MSSAPDTLAADDTPLESGVPCALIGSEYETYGYECLMRGRMDGAEVSPGALIEMERAAGMMFQRATVIADDQEACSSASSSGSASYLARMSTSIRSHSRSMPREVW